MKRLVISSTIAALIAGSAGLAVAGQPGPNGHNDYGLCKAYFAGSQTGQDHKHQAGPFQALEQAADQASGGNQDGTGTADEVASYCENVTPGGK